METVEHFVMKCEGIRTIREQHGVRGGVRVEKVLLFEGRTKEKVDGYTVYEDAGRGASREGETD